MILVPLVLAPRAAHLSDLKTRSYLNEPLDSNEKANYTVIRSCPAAPPCQSCSCRPQTTDPSLFRAASALVRVQIFAVLATMPDIGVEAGISAPTPPTAGRIGPGTFDVLTGFLVAFGV